MRNFRLMLSIGIVLSCLILVSCHGSNPVMPNNQQMTSSMAASQMATQGTTSGTNSTPVATSGTTTHGKATDVPAYYDADLFTINLQLLPENAQETTLNKNGQINNIYECDSCGFNFIAVIDAIPTDGMNPLWQEVQITFTDSNTPHQFFSDDEILAAAASGEITLTPTGEMYTCSVIGPK
jgi:hypothetical protein